VDFSETGAKLTRALDSLKKWTMEGYRTRGMQFSALLATLREMTDVGEKRPIIIFQTDGDEVAKLSNWPPIAGEQLRKYEYNMNDIYAEAERSRARVYTVVAGERLVGISPEEAAERAERMLKKEYVARAKIKDMWYGFKRVPNKAGKNTTGFAVPEVILKQFRMKRAERAIETLVEGQAAAVRTAELTGGWASFLEGPEQADEIYRRILADTDNRYVIGYYPTNKRMDGTLRRVRVGVRNHPEYVVRYRQGYYATPR
jgi:VWFA-related protein